MSHDRIAREESPIVILSAAKDLIRPSPRSFAALRMTMPILIVQLHNPINRPQQHDRFRSFNFIIGLGSASMSSPGR